MYQFPETDIDLYLLTDIEIKVRKTKIIQYFNVVTSEPVYTLIHSTNICNNQQTNNNI